MGLGPGEVYDPSALAADTGGSLYVADAGTGHGYGRIQKRDAQGNWSLVTPMGAGAGEVFYLRALAVDTAGKLYVAESVQGGGGPTQDRIQKRDAQGNWSVIATYGKALGQVSGPSALAVDTA